MIRLTDEEIADIVHLARGDINFENANNIAKAQLKKVVERLESINENGRNNVLHPKEMVYGLVIKQADWQALLEEVK